MDDRPPPTPPAQSSMSRDFERLDAAIAQAKRDAAHFYVAEDRNGQRFEKVMLRQHDLGIRLSAVEHRLTNIEKLLGILVEQGRARA